MAANPQKPILVQDNSPAAKIARLERQNAAMKRLVRAVQDLSLARTLPAVQEIVRTAARELTGADGATFVLREGDECFYVDENAIAPLWKGQRFPLSACVSGWAMLNRRTAVIEDIYSDSRVPADAYRPTFVKSLVMVPVRTEKPIAAIGNYWATRHRATTEEVELLQALANTTAVTLQSIQLYTELETRVRDRTSQLQQANDELQAFSYSVSHDLRSPLQNIAGYSELLAQDHSSRLGEKGRRYLSGITAGTQQMGKLINDLLRLAKVSHAELKFERVDMTALARHVVDHFKFGHDANAPEFRIQDGIEAEGDEGLLRVVLENLLSNARKYSAKKAKAHIEFGCVLEGQDKVYFVRDAGAGFDMKHSGRLFAPFQRLHSQQEFPGHGIGLATVRRIIHRHGGLIWAQAAVGKGAIFFFTLGSHLAVGT